MSDDWERLLDDFDQAISTQPPKKASVPAVTPPPAKAPPTISFATERRPSTDDLMRLVGAAKTPKNHEPVIAPSPVIPAAVIPVAVAPVAVVASTPLTAAPVAQRLLLEEPQREIAAPPLLASPTSAQPRPPAVAVPAAAVVSGATAETLASRLESRMSEILSREISEVVVAVNERLLDAAEQLETTEGKILGQISDQEGRLGEKVRKLVEEESRKNREISDSVASELGKLRAEIGEDRKFREIHAQVQSLIGNLVKRDKEDFARLAKEKDSIISCKAEISDLFRVADARVAAAGEILADTKREVRRQLEVAEDERRRAAAETEAVARMRREVEAERRALAADRAAVEEQARRVAEKAQEISEAWKKASEARDEVMQLCADVDREKETLVSEGRRLDELRDWVEAEKEQVLKNKVKASLHAKTVTDSLAGFPSPTKSAAYGALGGSGQEEKWSKMRQEAEQFHKMVTSLGVNKSILG